MLDIMKNSRERIRRNGKSFNDKRDDNQRIQRLRINEKKVLTFTYNYLLFIASIKRFSIIKGGFS